MLEPLYRLNDFSREEAFWNNTNKKPTIYKLDEFCRSKLKSNPNDILALRTILALAINYGSIEHNFTDIVDKLVQVGELSGELLTGMYLTGDITDGGEGDCLAGLLIKLDLSDEAGPRLEMLADSKNNFVSNWAKKVLDKIENQ